jgi:hypothetical protein
VHLNQTKKPQQKFLTHFLGLLLMLPGHATFRNLSRYSAYHERTFARWYARDFDFVSLNQATIIRVIPPAHEQALVIDASFVPQSGKKTSGLDRFWNGSHSRTEKGAHSALRADSKRGYRSRSSVPRHCRAGVASLLRLS